eukprot:CAMPEP_0198735062 /NCGR_PEP_ID=MMETSP1475-20131203/57094_1 /TAXON_ID= ORGANISM="Unidentified sp., Strain CCMP1999" /NCGR_SAMPLE_ID=MMETSP1475 /ASSEMBLY_ACC=CAM_ASM_001111 /LENGTH=247 /DNA_ID=CAMNT_0044498659 /DNA_START=24 /DNA_END=767 /DNA_ORIENTATION=-
MGQKLVSFCVLYVITTCLFKTVMGLPKLLAEVDRQEGYAVRTLSVVPTTPPTSETADDGEILAAVNLEESETETEIEAPTESEAEVLFDLREPCDPMIYMGMCFYQNVKISACDVTSDQYDRDACCGSLQLVRTCVMDKTMECGEAVNLRSFYEASRIYVSPVHCPGVRRPRLRADTLCKPAACGELFAGCSSPISSSLCCSNLDKYSNCIGDAEAFCGPAVVADRAIAQARRAATRLACPRFEGCA